MDILELFYRAYSDYYDITKSGDETAPFDAMAAFDSRTEQYFLLKSAKLAEENSQEYVFFKVCDTLSEDELRRLSDTAWRMGEGRCEVDENHKSTDVTLIVICDRLAADGIRKAVKKIRYSRSYMLGLRGFCRFRLAVVETSSNTALFNAQGSHLKGLVADILKRRR